MVRFSLAFVALAMLMVSVVRAADESDVPRLMERLLKDEAVGSRRGAAIELGKLGPKAKKAVPTLIDALKDVDGRVRDEAEIALRKIGELSVEPLVEALKKEKDEFVRLRIVNILGAIGPDAKAALSALEAATKDESSFVRDAAKEALYRVQLDAKTLLAMLKDKDDEKRQYAVRVLAILSTEQAKPAVQELCKVIKSDKSKIIRQDAAKTLSKLGKDKQEMSAADRLVIITALAGALKDADDTVKLNAAVGLGEIGREAVSARPALAQAYRIAKSEELKEALKKADEQVAGKKPGS